MTPMLNSARNYTAENIINPDKEKLVMLWKAAVEELIVECERERNNVVTSGSNNYRRLTLLGDCLWDAKAVLTSVKE
jgi:chloramphenicol 3-O-phosphotransferase